MPDQIAVHERLHRLARFAVVAAVAVSVLVLAGWLLKVPALASGVPGKVAMNPLTAVLFILTAASLWLLTAADVRPAQRIAGQALAALVALGGASILMAYFAGWETGPDRVLFAAELGSNRMAPNTALLFVLTGVALLMLRGQRIGFWTSHALTLLVAAAALMSLVGYSYGTRTLYGIASYIPMALNTAALFEVVALGLLCARPDRGLAAVLAAADLGGVMARRLLPAAILIPCVMGLFRILGQRAGLYDTEFGAALMVVLNVVILVAAVVVTASALNRADAERRRAMEALSKTVAEVRDLYNNAPCGYHSLDDSGRIVAMNDTELRWLGYERRDVENCLHFSDLLTTDSRAAFSASFPRIQQQGQVADLELDMVRKDGTTIPVVVNATAVRDSQGRFVASRSSVFDATERKRAQQALELLNQELEHRVAQRTSELAGANRDLVQKNQENEMFVYSVSHDLRSPLVSLQGFSKELGLSCGELEALVARDSVPAEVQTQARGLIDGGMRQSIRFIQTAVLRLSNIIDALLRLSRAGRVEYQHQKVDVQAVVSRVVESTRLAQFDGAVEIQVGDLPPCCGDTSAVEQVFANLIGNAIKYRDPRRTCEIEVAGSAAANANADAVTYYVQDTGLGIPAASREKIFLAFKRAHPAVAEGDGMGLAIVRRVVERLGGKVWVESEVGEGSTFFVALPAAGPASFDSQLVPFAKGGSTYARRTDGHLAGRG